MHTVCSELVNGKLVGHSRDFWLFDWEEDMLLEVTPGMLLNRIKTYINVLGPLEFTSPLYSSFRVGSVHVNFDLKTMICKHRNETKSSLCREPMTESEFKSMFPSANSFVLASILNLGPEGMIWLTDREWLTFTEICDHLYNISVHQKFLRLK